ncbi:hypothetical protein YC2023_065801 [Brassica napus]
MLAVFVSLERGISSVVSSEKFFCTGLERDVGFLSLGTLASSRSHQICWA